MIQIIKIITKFKLFRATYRIVNTSFPGSLKNRKKLINFKYAQKEDQANRKAVKYCI